jgi:hypothetical protein
VYGRNLLYISILVARRPNFKQIDADITEYMEVTYSEQTKVVMLGGGLTRAPGDVRLLV